MRSLDSRTKHWIGRTIAAAVLLAAIGFGACVYLGISSSLHAERGLHSINLVTVLVDRFLQQEKRWPTSWKDLYTITDAKAPSMYSWPKDSETVQEFVAIDFDANLSRIASQTVEDFDAIKPIGSCYDYKQYHFVSSLIEDAKNVVDSQH
jgi:hypothetical protein